MGWLDKIADTAKSTLNLVQGEISKFMNKSTMEATMAATAMVCTANGEMKSEELAALHACLAQNEALKAFKPTDMQIIFQKYYDKFKGTMKIAAQAEVLGKLRSIDKGSEAAYALVGVCCEIANADGVFDDEEKKHVKRICESVGVNPNDLGLNIG